MVEDDWNVEESSIGWCFDKIGSFEVSKCLFLETAKSRPQANGHTQLSLFNLSSNVLHSIFSEMLTMRDLCRLDSAICFLPARETFLASIASRDVNFNFEVGTKASSGCMEWILQRKLSIKRMKCRNDVTSDVLTRFVAAGCSLKLKYLHLDNCFQLTPKSVELLAANASGLEVVHLDYCDYVVDSLVVAFASQCQKLVSLSLTSCKKITDKAIEALAMHSSHLASLKLCGCSLISDAALLALASGACAAGLTSLNLKSCKISDRGLAALAKSCPNLQSLNLSRCGSLTDGCVAAAVGALPRLQCLMLEHCRGVGDGAVMAAARTCPLLQHVDLGSTRVTGGAVAELARRCVDLRVLRLRACLGVTTDAVGEVYARCLGIAEVDLTGCGKVVVDCAAGHRMRHFLGHEEGRVVR